MYNNLFTNDLLNELLSKNAQNKHLYSLKATAQYILYRHVSLNKKHVRFNQAAFMNKNLRKAGQDYAAYKKQRNVCVKQLRKTKKYFFGNLILT